MARLDTSGYTPVIILGDAEWLSLRAVAMGGRILKDRVARRLRRSGVLDDQGITPSAAPALHGVAGAVRHLDVARFEPTRRGYRAEAWIGPQRATIVKHEPDGYHVYGLDECEVPSAFTELLDVRPRPNIDLGPRLLPQTGVQQSSTLGSRTHSLMSWPDLPAGLIAAASRDSSAGPRPSPTDSPAGSGCSH